MHILIVQNNVIPAFLYGGTERVIWGLGKELNKKGIKVSYLVSPGSYCDFADIYFFDPLKKISQQVPTGVDLIHFNSQISEDEKNALTTPYIITQHGNVKLGVTLDPNTVFISKDHAQRHQSDTFVHNGLDWDEYSPVDWTLKRKHFHFLGKASRRVKNVKGAIDSVKHINKEKMVVLGGKRFYIKQIYKPTLSPRVKFKGMVGGAEKFNYLNHSKGLLFPVKWHEPFGLAIIESLYYGCPVFATPYGASPELVPSSMGYLTDVREEMTEALKHSDHYNKKECHERAVDLFNAEIMMRSYYAIYEKILNGELINTNLPTCIKSDRGFGLGWRDKK